MNIPAKLARILDAIVLAGGFPMLVGGCVRDSLMGIEPKDHDVEVYCLKVSELKAVLENFGKVNEVGVSFGILKVGEFDFSIPRRENKQGQGHRGFIVELDPTLLPVDAAARRDFTINSMYWDFRNQCLVDDFGGAVDIVKGRLHPTSRAFQEDSLRVLRGMQFAARFDMWASDALIFAAMEMKKEYPTLAKERVWGEWQKWALKGVRPSSGLAYLWRTGWLDLYPELKALEGLPQDPIWHPEGDAFVHTCHVCDAMAELCSESGITGDDRVVLMFAALCHDLGKAVTTTFEGGRWRSPGHAEAGVPITESFLNSLGCPVSLVPRVLPLVREHMVHVTSDITPRTVRRLATRLVPSNLTELMFIIRADSFGRPPLPKVLGDDALKLERVGKEVKVELDKPKPIVMGRDLIERGMKPGPDMGRFLKMLYEAQLDGGFSTLEEGLEFLNTHVAVSPDSVRS